jgi:nucleoside-diphosphate-sugar epimerase
MSRVFVTGATGFVGSHVVRRLVNLGHDVHILCRMQSNFWRIADLLPHVHAYIAPLEDADRLRAIVHEARPEYIYHLAAATLVAGTAPSSAHLVGVNLLGTVQLLEALDSIDYAGFVSTGDSFEYTPQHTRLAETDDCHPDALHGIAKLATTLYGQALAKSKQRPILTLRLFSTYGPGDHPRRLVPKVIQGALAGTPISLSRPTIARDWVYMDDVVDLYLLGAANAGRLAGTVLNAGSGICTNLGEITALVLRLTNSQSETRWGVFPAPHHDDFPWVADPTAVRAALGWTPRISLEAGLQATIDYERSRT